MQDIIEILREQKSISMPTGMVDGDRCVGRLVDCPVCQTAADVIEAMKAALEAVLYHCACSDSPDGEKIRKIASEAMLSINWQPDMSNLEYEKQR